MAQRKQILFKILLLYARLNTTVDILVSSITNLEVTMVRFSFAFRGNPNKLVLAVLQGRGIDLNQEGDGFNFLLIPFLMGDKILPVTVSRREGSCTFEFKGTFQGVINGNANVSFDCNISDEGKFQHISNDDRETTIRFE